MSVECLQFARRLPCEFRASGLSSRSRAVGAGDDGEVEYVPGVVEVHVAEGEQLGDALHGEDEGEDVVHDLNERCRAKGREHSHSIAPQ